jgi:hypothetical protein
MKLKILSKIWLIIFIYGCETSHKFSNQTKKNIFFIDGFSIKHKKHYSQHFFEFLNKRDKYSGLMVLGDDRFKYLPNTNVEPTSFIKIGILKYEFCYYSNDSLLIWHSDKIPESSINVPNQIKLLLPKIDSLAIKTIPHYESQKKYWFKLNQIGKSYYR